MKTSAIVIGGGIVGVCNALALRQAGHQVTLIDRKQPGHETSYGNAGVLSESSIMVLNNPNMLRALPKLLLGKSLGLRYSTAFVLKTLPPDSPKRRDPLPSQTILGISQKFS